VVRADSQGLTDHSPADVSIRSRVNEYGGGALCLVPGGPSGAIAYVNQADQRVWLYDGPGTGEPVALTPAPPPGELHRHGGLSATTDGDWVLAVREVHREGSHRPVRSVVALSTRAAEPCASTLLEGRDFYGTPAAHPAGDRVAVVAWDHPDMPWDASLLLVLPLTRHACAAHADPGAHDVLTPAAAATSVAGGAAESIGQPAWRNDGSLRFVSDRNGWWQPYLATPATLATTGTLATSGGKAEPVLLAVDEAEFHGPDWVLGQRTMAEQPDDMLVARRTAAGQDEVVVIAPRAGASSPEPIDQPCVAISALCAHRDGVAFIGSTAATPSNVWVWTQTGGPRTIRAQPDLPLGGADVAGGEPFNLTGRTGRRVHGRLYRPTLEGTTGPADSAPPLITWCHGGPTSSAQAGFDLTVQFFTSRGFAVASVDYAGSSGYGRAYRNALWGEWGVADSDDCLDAARHLAALGEVDGERMAIRGGSAGGMTALNALAAGEGFAACASWYGVTDLMGLVATTHDFEAHYTDRLVGPLPGARALYEERSPVRRAASMRGAVLLLQGTEDAVVPPAQAESMRAALRATGTPCQLEFYEGEGHGFRRADTLTACLEAELAFYRRHLRL
jgi:dipeptidyl aminopeptidase/acylaminoacyl peptidase